MCFSYRTLGTLLLFARMTVQHLGGLHYIHKSKFFLGKHPRWHMVCGRQKASQRTCGGDAVPTRPVKSIFRSRAENIRVESTFNKS